MKGIPYILALFVVLSLSCGMQAQIPTPTHPARIAPRTIATVTAIIHRMMVCMDHVNARGERYQVIARLLRGDVVYLTGTEIVNGAEVWQPTNRGLIDPQYLCEVK